jgi:hypothetical protein
MRVKTAVGTPRETENRSTKAKMAEWLHGMIMDAAEIERRKERGMLWYAIYWKAAFAIE